MNKWYRACVEYNASVPEYHALLHKNVFTEHAALASIKKLNRYYDEKNFPMDPDYEIRMDHLITVVREHEAEEEMELWRIWMKYFVTMGGSEWKEFWSESGNLLCEASKLEDFEVGKITGMRSM